MAKNVNTLIKVSVLGNKELIQLRQNVELYSKNLRELKKENKDVKNINKETAQSFAENEAKLRAARAEYKKAQSQLKNMSQATKNAGGFTMKMAKAFGVAQLAVDGLKKITSLLTQQIKDSVNVFKDFDFQMQKVRAISGATDFEFKKLKESAESLGRTTFFTATQVASLQTNLSKLGFTAEEILQAQEATLATATATGEDLARTATVMGSAIRGFGLEATEATRVADVMASAFTSSALDIEKFQTSMTKVAPIAKMAGFEIEGTTAILASLTDAGIEASIAGTSLRNILLRLADPTSKLSKRLGGSVKSVDELLPRLKAMKDEGIALSDVLGITDRRTAAAFGRMLDSADNVAILTEQLRNSEGAAAAMAAIVGDSLEGALLRFKSATDGLKIALVDLFGKRLQNAFDSFAKFFNALASEKSIKNLQRLGSAIKITVLAIAAYRLGTMLATKATTLFIATKKLSANAFQLATASANLYHAAKLRVIAATRAFGVAIAQTGIGLFVIALGTLIAKMITYNNEVGESINLNKHLREGERDLALQIKQTETNLGRLRETRELINKMSKEGNTNKERYHKLVKAEKKLIADLNKELKNNNKSLISQKDSIDKITTSITGEGGLIDAMRNLMLTEAFQDMNKELLRVATASDMIKVQLGEAFEGITSEQIAKANKELKEMGGLKGTLTELGTDLTDIIMSLFNPEHKDINADIEMLDTLLETYGITLEQFLDTLEDGYFEDMESKIKNIILERGSATGLDISDLLGGTSTGGGEDEDIKSITAKIEQEAQRHAKALLDIGNKSYKFESDRNILQLEEEIKHLETMKLLNMKMGEDGLKEDLKIQKKRDKLLKESNKQKLDVLNQEKIDRKLKIDEDFANELMTEIQHKQALLDLEAWFLGEKAGLIAQDFQAYLENENARRQLDIDGIDLEKKAYQERIKSVDDLGSAMSELGDIMGENHILTKIGTKLSQAAAVAKNLEALKTALNTQTTAAETQVNLANAGSEAAQGVASQSKQMFPMNLAAMAATLALVVSVLSLFGAGMGGGNQSIDGGEVFNQGSSSYQFAKGGLTKGGMFKGKSHANGGVKFAVGGRVMEAEGGEAIINKRSTSMFRPVLSAINSYNGNGVKFADGGLLNSGEKFARGGQLSDVSRMLSQQQITQKVIMVESDVTRTQNRVSAVESQATF